jgi:hypothetical protein
MEQKKQKTRGRIRAILAAAAALVLIVGALLVVLYRDQLTPQKLNDTFGESKTGAESEPFTYEAGSGQVFAVSGNRLAVASSTGVQLLGDKGETLAREVFSMGTPAIAASEKYCAFYDAGGTSLRLADANGAVSALDTKAAILSASVNEGGFLSVVTEETGYKAAVTVYDSALQPVFAWHSGSAYVLAAQVAPNGRTLAALCVDGEGSRLLLFSLSSEKPLGSFEAGNELFWHLRWMGRDRICLLSETRLVFLDASAKQAAAYDFGGKFLLDYDLGASFAALVLGEYRSGGSSELIAVDTQGREKGRTPIRQRDVLSLSAGAGGVLVLYADSLELMSESLAPVNSTKDVLGARQALLRKDGKCLLLSAYSAELVSLS